MVVALKVAVVVVTAVVAVAMAATVYGPLVDIIMVWMKLMNVHVVVDMSMACKYLYCM